VRKLILLIAVAAVLAALAVPALAATRTISVGDNWFVRKGSPTTVTVTKGTTVRWRWVGHAPHNVNVTSGPVRFRSTVKTSGTYAKKVTRAGRYRIVCTIHPGMEMTLRVR
jgi:plastocyanin